MCLSSGLEGNGVNAQNFWSAGADAVRAEGCISKKMTCGSGNSGSCRLCDTLARTPTKNALCCTAVFAHQDPLQHCEDPASLSLFCFHGALISGKKNFHPHQL